MPPRVAGFSAASSAEKGSSNGPLHEGLAEHLGDEDAAAARRVEEARAAAGSAAGEVERADDPRLGLDEGLHVALVEGVVAEGDAVGAGLEEERGVRAAQAHAAGGVLAVDHDEIERPVAAQPRQMLSERGAAGPAHHVAEKE